MITTRVLYVLLLLLCYGMAGLIQVQNKLRLRCHREIGDSNRDR